MEDYGYKHNDYISCLKCRRDGDGAEFASLVISTCPTKELANRNGRLVCAADAGPAARDPALAAPPPAEPAPQPAAASPSAAAGAGAGEASSRQPVGGSRRSNE